MTMREKSGRKRMASRAASRMQSGCGGSVPTKLGVTRRRSLPPWSWAWTCHSWTKVRLADAAAGGGPAAAARVH